MQLDSGEKRTSFLIGIWNFIMTPEPGFEPGSEAPQASRISNLPHSGWGHMGKWGCYYICSISYDWLSQHRATFAAEKIDLGFDAPALRSIWKARR